MSAMRRAQAAHRLKTMYPIPVQLDRVHAVTSGLTRAFATTCTSSTPNQIGTEGHCFIGGKLPDLCGNRLLQNDIKDTLCEMRRRRFLQTGFCLSGLLGREEGGRFTAPRKVSAGLF